MKKIASLAAIAALTVGSVLGAATAASAHNPLVALDCDSLTVSLNSYPAGSTVTLTVDDVDQGTFDFDGSFEKTIALDSTVKHSYKVFIDSADGDKYDKLFGGYSLEECLPEVVVPPVEEPPVEEPPVEEPPVVVPPVEEPPVVTPPVEQPPVVTPPVVEAPPVVETPKATPVTPVSGEETLPETGVDWGLLPVAALFFGVGGLALIVAHKRKESLKND